MDIVSHNLITKSLDALNLRQNYLAQNIANANTDGYVPIEVSFEAALGRALRSGELEKISQLSPEVSFRQNVSENAELRLDLELAESAQTSMRYRALIDILGRQMSLERTVIQGGRQ